MSLNKIFRNTLLLVFASILLSACAVKTTGKLQGDVYTGKDTVEYLASGVPDRVFFATNETVLTTASRETLRKQASWLRKNSKINVVLEGHADERGTREYNLALGQRRADAVSQYLILNGIDSSRLILKSYGEERPVSFGQDERSYAKNRRVEIN